MPKQDVSIAGHFAELPDPRVDRTKKHSLGDILVVVLCAVVCGADSWEEVEAFGKAKAGWLKRFLALPNGIPSHDTFYRVFVRGQVRVQCSTPFGVTDPFAPDLPTHWPGTTYSTSFQEPTHHAPTRAFARHRTVCLHPAFLEARGRHAPRQVVKDL